MTFSVNFNSTSLSNQEETGKKVAKNLDNYENLLLNAYSAGDKTAALGKVAESLGMTVEYGSDGKPTNITSEEVQQVAQTKYQKAMRSFSAFNEIMSQAHQMLMSLINKIGK